MCDKSRRLWAGGVVAAMLAGMAMGAAMRERSAQAERLPPQVLRHIVMAQFKEDTPAAQVRAIEQAFCELPGKIEEIEDFEWGTEASAESRSQGYTHCFVLMFKNRAGLEAYQPHQAHQDFVSLARPHLEKLLVFDYWTRP